MADSHEWVQVQAKTFTKWVNLHLAPVHSEIGNVKEDLADGVRMIKLLEVLGGEPICKSYNKDPKMRIHQLENMNQCLTYLTEKQKLKLVNIGSSDIVDKNERITLALLWSCILHFQVANIEIEGIAGKSALLLWCKRSVERFPNLRLENFTNSWADGLGFAGLIARYRPDLVDFDAVSALPKRERLEKVFDVAKTKLGIPSLLDVSSLSLLTPQVSDLESQAVDEKSIITYVSEYFKTFAPLSKASSLVKALKQAWRTADGHGRLIHEIEEGSSRLKAWMEEKTQAHSAAPSLDSLEACKRSASELEAYGQGEKADFHLLLLNLDGVLSRLHASQKRTGRPLYQTPIPMDSLNASWQRLCEADTLFGARVQTRTEELEGLTLKGQRLECLLNRIQSQLKIIVPSSASREGSLELQLDRVGQSLEDCGLVAAAAEEVESLGRELEGKLPSAAHGAERAACLRSIESTRSSLQSAHEGLQAALARQHHWEELSKDYQKRTHQYLLSLQQYEDELQVPLNHPWNADAPTPALPSLEVLVEELSEGKLTPVEPSMATLEKERQRVETMRAAKRKEREEFHRGEEERKTQEAQRRAQVARFEEEVTSRLKELNQAVERGDAPLVERLHQEIDSLPSAAKVGLHDRWTRLGRLFRENGLVTKEEAAQKQGSASLEAEQLQEISSVFYTYDRDKTGHLQEGDFQSCLTSLGFVLGEDVSGRLEDADREHKGSVTLNDLVDYIQRNQDPGEGPEALERAFAAFHPAPLPEALGRTLFGEEWEPMLRLQPAQDQLWPWKDFLAKIYSQ